jgi:hypothetical protein
MGHHHSTLLTPAEQQQFNAAPALTYDERQWYFTLNDAEQAACRQFVDAFTRAHFVLLLGYFKVKKMRLVLTWGQTRDDLEYIFSRYFASAPRPRQSLGKKPRSRIYRSIFELTNYSPCTSARRDSLTRYLNDLTPQCMNKRYLLHECLLFLERNLVETPAYTTLDDLIGNALQRLEKGVIDRVQSVVSTDDLKSLQVLLQKADDHYGITGLKRPIKDFSYQQTGIAIEQSQTLRVLYPLGKRVIEASELSPLNVRQLASIPQQ